MDNTLFTVNNVWMMICTALVFLMHLGFSLLEIGLTRQKNTINILFKNVFIISIGLILSFPARLFLWLQDTDIKLPSIRKKTPMLSNLG